MWAENVALLKWTTCVYEKPHEILVPELSRIVVDAVSLEKRVVYGELPDSFKGSQGPD